MTTPHIIKDVVVVLPGIMGSTLARNGSPVWDLSAGSVLRAIKTFGGSIRNLTLPAGISDEYPDDGVEPIALMPNLHTLPGIWGANTGYCALLAWLRTRFHLIEQVPGSEGCIPNLLPIPYDWRLSNRYNGRRLKRIVEPALERWRAQGGIFADAKLIFVCHSMGGLVARWYIEKEGGTEFTRKLVTLGTPYRGALNALGQLVNGVHKGIGRLSLDLTTFARSLPSIHQLLPEYACIESADGLLKTTETTLPELNTAMVADAMKFHDELDEAAASRPSSPYDLHPIVGRGQTTYTTARIAGSSVIPIETIHGENVGGDATVPRLSASPRGESLDSPIISYIPDQHGSLQGNRSVLDQIEGILTAKPVIYRAGSSIEIDVRIEPLVLFGESIFVEATVCDEERVALQAQVFDELGRKVAVSTLRHDGETHRATVDSLPPGAYRVMVGGVGSTAERVCPVTSNILVWK